MSGTGVPSYRFDSMRQVVHVPHQDVVGKLGFPAATGWLTHTGSGAALTQRFAVLDGAPYPDGGSRVEVWLEHPVARPLAELGGLDPPARIMECEVLGPLVDLAPGESTSLVLDCQVHPAAAP